jgi:dynein heavy chain
MLQNVKSANFNIFDKDLSLEWSRVVAEFKNNNEIVNSATRDLIDTSFRKLRSAEGAFELLQNFKSIESKGAIKEQMTNKLNDILDQFSREIDLVRVLSPVLRTCLRQTVPWIHNVRQTGAALFET